MASLKGWPNLPDPRPGSEHLLAEIRRQRAVLLQVLRRHQAVAVDALALVDPEQHHLTKTVGAVTVEMSR